MPDARKYVYDDPSFSSARDYPKAFSRIKAVGAASGATRLHLQNVDEPTIRFAITAAYQQPSKK